MATSLRNSLNDLASAFASSVLAAIRGVSLEDLLSETAGGGRRGARGRPAAGAGRAPRASRGGGRLARRSAGDIAGVIDKIVGLLKQSPRGLRAEQIRARLGLLAKEMPRPIKEALAAGRIGKSGQKRSTVYFLKGAGAPARAPGAKNAKKAKTSAPAKARKAGSKRSKGAKRAKSTKGARRAKAKPSAKRAARPRRRGGRSASRRARPAKKGAKAAPPPAAAAPSGGPPPAPGAAS